MLGDIVQQRIQRISYVNSLRNFFGILQMYLMSTETPLRRVKSDPPVLSNARPEAPKDGALGALSGQHLHAIAQLLQDVQGVAGARMGGGNTALTHIDWHER